MSASLLVDCGAMRKAPMTPEEIRKGRDDIVASRGPWRSDNLRLAKNVFTIGEGEAGREARVRRAVQVVADIARSRLSGLRVLDLSCGEGGLALELGKDGAEVVAFEGQAALAEKASFARDALGLHHVTIVRGDVRRLSPEEHGFFDVILALGVLDRLDAPAVFEVAAKLGSVCKGFALVEARIVPRARATREGNGILYRGSPRSRDGEPSFLLTRASMLSLLTRSGFTSIVETLHPEAEAGVPCFAAFKGRRVALQTAPQANAVPPTEWGDASPAAEASGIARLLRRGRR